ncbi:MAG: PD40 domain-containing protein [Bacteroidales bacterium]|nr:PD40 domain-containing protein [Bacteroidales bacterium]
MKRGMLRYRGVIFFVIIGSLMMTTCSKDEDDPENKDPEEQEETLTGKLAFVSYDDGDGEIYVMNADGTDLTQLTDNNANDVQPSWSPDGSRIAFDSYGYRMPAEIYTMKADGSNLTQITHDPAETDFAEEWPSWSPDGSRIVFESYRDAESEHNGTTIANANLYAANSDGSGGDVRITNHLFYDGIPSWSPNGSKIAFVHAQVDTIGEALYSSGYQVWVMNSNGSNWIKLTTEGSNNLRPKWSPDGTKIVYQSDDGICVADLNGDCQKTGIYGGNPSWSPDGEKIIFDSNDEICVMNPDGTNVKKIVTTVGARQVVWTE